MSKRGRARSRLWSREHVRSGFEGRIKKKLEDSKVPFEYETEKFKYTVEKTYTPDFIILLKRGKKRYVEAKGLFKSEDRKKMQIIKQMYPDIDLRILFQRDQPIRKGSNTLYSMWAEKSGFIWAVGDEVPIEWLK